MPAEAAAPSSKAKGGVTMWDFKKCPRCRGDIFIEEDAERCYEKCLQCGYERELERVKVSRRSPDNEKEKSGVY
jgi:hypothetical protein